MTSTVEIEPSDVRSEGVGEKRPAEEDVGVSLVENEVLPSSHKRIKGGSERDLKKVAEMVLVLAAMGKMRGGRRPTLAEKELMAEARNRLSKVCEGFAPKDVFPRDAFGGLIEDLGLNKLNDQRTGFHPPKISIADKLLISKRKMEKAEDLSLLSTPHSAQRLQGTSVATVESHGASHSVKISHLTSNCMSMPAGNIQSSSPLGHVTTSTATTPLPYQLPTSEIKPIVSTASTSRHLGAAALPRVDRTQLRSDGGSNGSVHPSQIQVNHTANSAMRTSTWTVQPHSAQSANVGSNNKVPANMSLRFEGAANFKSGLPSQVASRAVIAQTTGPSSQGTNYAHAETAKIVQKLLQPRVSDRRAVWNPPSRDYMSKALPCQMCRSAVTEIDSILICDACEKGYHLKCLQVTYQKSISKAEWHCGKCLSLSDGKPLPPKYGRVMRNINTPKLSSDSPAVPSPKSKIFDASDDKVPQSKMTVNRNNLSEIVPTEVAGNNSQIPGSKREDVMEIQENDNDTSKVKINDIASGTYDIAPGTCPSNTTNSSLCDCVLSIDSSGGKPGDEKAFDMNPSSSVKSELDPNSPDKSQANVNSQHGNPNLLNDEASPSMQSLENYVTGHSEDIHRDETLNNAHQPQEQEVACDNPSEIAIDTGIVNRGISSTGGLHAVNWVGDPTQVLDDKIFYESCSITEHLYKAMDYVLIRFEDGKIIPSKVQTMWEDKNTTIKWVTVNQCYFPGDLPEAVGRPCGLESREVYESTKGRTLMAGLIQSPCEVLPPRKFEEEIERRTRTGTQPNDHLPPLYLCKWIYDEAKGVFRDISC